MCIRDRPYHVGSKDVAFPRLNSLGFWIQPCGYLLIAKIGFLRTMCWKNNDKIDNYFKLKQSEHYSSFYFLDELQKTPKTLINNLFLNQPEKYELKNQDKPIEEIINLNFLHNYDIGAIVKTNDMSWKLVLWRTINSVSYTHLDVYKRQL